tara:strand:+ start:496 stop:2571 length:2076 start_codon:yes stop_codon:yes gene_type:complete
MKFLNNLDLQSNELQNAVIHNYAGNPDATLTGTEGQIVYSTTVDAIFINTDGSTAWDRLATGSSAVATVTAGDSSIVVGGTSANPTIAHADTSSVGNVTAASRTYVTALTFDTYGHVTAVSTAAETVTNTNTTYTTSAVDSSNDAIIRLTGSDSSTEDIKLVAGSNVTITPSGDDITIASANDNDIDYVSGASFSSGTLTLTGTGNAGASVSLDGRYLTAEADGFKTISVAGQSDVVADSATDTLTLVGAGGTTISTAAGTDTITITSANTNDNDFVTGAAFASGTGIVTLSVANQSDVTVDLDGRYLTSFTEADTLDTVTGRGATTSNDVTVGSLIVNGDLTVSGAHTVTLAEEVKVEDSIFVLNSNETGTPSEDAGLVIERGTETNVAMLWDESADQFAFVESTETGTTAGNVTIADYASLRAGAIKADDTLNLGSVVNAGADVDKFLVLDASGNVDFRTGAEVMSDIGATSATGTMDDFTISDGSNSSVIGDGNTLTISGTGLITATESAGTVTISTTANNFVHPTQTAIAVTGTGASVVDSVTVNTLGHTTAVTKRTLTLANLGYTGATDANNYVLPTSSVTVTGGVELATTTEASAGTDTGRAVTPAGVEAHRADRRFKATIGDGSATSIAVTHNLGTTDVIVQIFDISTGDTVYADVVRTSVNVVTVDFGAAPANNDIRILIQEL